MGTGESSLSISYLGYSGNFHPGHSTNSSLTFSSLFISLRASITTLSLLLFSLLEMCTFFHSSQSQLNLHGASVGRGRRGPGRWWEGRGHLRSSVSWIWSPGQCLMKVWSPEFGCREGQTSQGSVSCYLVLLGELGAPPDAKKPRLRG